MKDKYLVAIHEAGHILISQKLGRSLTTILKQEKGEWTGLGQGSGELSIQINNKLKNKVELSIKDKLMIEDLLEILVAGKIAEEIYILNEKKTFKPIDLMHSDSMDMNNYGNFEINILKRTHPFEFRYKHENDARSYISNNYNNLLEIANELCENNIYHS